jgi:hypothetical protein
MNTRPSLFRALAMHGKTILLRGNVSMEEVTSYIGVSDAILSGELPAVISSSIPSDVTDPDSLMELAITEVTAQGDIGQVPPVESVISMDTPEQISEVDTLVDESEELNALSEFGIAITATPSLSVAESLENYKSAVIGCFTRISVSKEDIEQIEEANDIETVIGKVDDIRDVADALIEQADESGGEVSTESLFSEDQRYTRAQVKARVANHMMVIKTRQEK